MPKQEVNDLMELLYASCVGLLVSCGVFLILRSRTFTGCTRVNDACLMPLIYFCSLRGVLVLNKAAVLGYSSEYADPLPQALVLTAIVIGFAMTAFVVILAIRGQTDLGNDHVDGQVSR